MPQGRLHDVEPRTAACQRQRGNPVRHLSPKQHQQFVCGDYQTVLGSQCRGARFCHGQLRKLPSHDDQLGELHAQSRQLYLRNRLLGLPRTRWKQWRREIGEPHCYVSQLRHLPFASSRNMASVYLEAQSGRDRDWCLCYLPQRDDCERQADTAYFHNRHSQLRHLPCIPHQRDNTPVETHNVESHADDGDQQLQYLPRWWSYPGGWKNSKPCAVCSAGVCHQLRFLP